MELYYFLTQHDEKRKSFLDHIGESRIGWGNGYVIIPKEHPLFGVEYWDVEEQIEVHGGLTFSQYLEDMNLNVILDGNEHLQDSNLSKKRIKDYWIFGFDTCHINSGNFNTKQKVLNETLYLKEQLEEIKSFKLIDDLIKENL